MAAHMMRVTVKVQCHVSIFSSPWHLIQSSPWMTRLGDRTWSSSHAVAVEDGCTIIPRSRVGLGRGETSLSGGI